MEYKTIKDKLDLVIKNMNLKIQKLEKKQKSYSEKRKSLKKDDDLVKYHYELEKSNYYYLKYNDEIKRSYMFIDRCNYYKDYFDALNSNDALEIKKCEYNLFRKIQEETIFYFDAKINELDQKISIANIVDSDRDLESEKDELIKKRDKIYEKFISKNFTFDQKKIEALDYLNYDILSVIDLIYKTRTRKKAS